MKIFLLLLILLYSLTYSVAQAKLKVVTTLSDYAVITKQLAGNLVEVTSIVAADEDPHHVRPKPSFALAMSRADLFVTTGLDLELWVPSLINRAGNPKIRSGQVGYVAAASGIPLLDKPKNLSHSEGGLHIYGNPHIATSPLNMLYVAKNIATGLAKVDPTHHEAYQQAFVHFSAQLYKRLFGKDLVKLLGGEILFQAAEKGMLYKFLKQKNLFSKLGGWFKQVAPYAGNKFVSYHKNWDYLSKILNLSSIETIEVKPGVPPTPSHVMNVIQTMKRFQVKSIIGASYFSISKMRMVASKVGAKLIILTMGAKTSDKSVMDKFDRWAKQLK
jgi:ABC-type Zn uptake system ZnuABC Zn-binding protein ZnuA